MQKTNFEPSTKMMKMKRMKRMNQIRIHCCFHFDVRWKDKKKDRWRGWNRLQRDVDSCV